MSTTRFLFSISDAVSLDTTRTPNHPWVSFLSLLLNRQTIHCLYSNQNGSLAFKCKLVSHCPWDTPAVLSFPLTVDSALALASLTRNTDSQLMTQMVFGSLLKCHFPPRGLVWDLPGPGLTPGSHAWQADSLPSEPPGKLLVWPHCSFLSEPFLP